MVDDTGIFISVSFAILSDFFHFQNMCYLETYVFTDLNSPFSYI